VKDRFTRARDKSLEGEVARYARALPGQAATIWEAVYETPDAHYEHDVIAFDDELVIVFEAKASPPKEPFRDPERAFARIRDAFRSDTGIQKAYEQGKRIIRRLEKREVVSFFDQDGREKGSIKQASQLAICACITRDDFGPLATNLSLLLQKDPEDAYPWAANILDLVAGCWRFGNFSGLPGIHCTFGTAGFPLNPIRSASRSAFSLTHLIGSLACRHDPFLTARWTAGNIHAGSCSTFRISENHVPSYCCHLSATSSAAYPGLRCSSIIALLGSVDPTAGRWQWRPEG
jgi:hypothetical protein